MEILDTIIKREIDLIGSSSQPVIRHGWEVIFKANGKEIKPLYVNTSKLDRLYMENFADELRFTVTFVAGDFYSNILPYKTELEVTLIKIPKYVNGEGDDNTKSRITNTYRAQITVGDSEVIGGDTPLAISKDAAHQTSVKEVTFQCYNMAIDRIRKLTFGRNFRKTSPIDAIRYILGTCTKVPVANNADNIRGVNVADGYVLDKVPEHIPIPDLTDIIKVPKLINETVGGIYPTGFAYYLQAGMWYVFPPFDSERFGKQTPSLTIIKVPKHRMPASPKTFRVEAGQVVILSTRETVHRDISEANQLNQGNGVRFADADKLMEDYGIRDGNKMTVNASDYVTEAISEKRADGDLVKGADTLFTSNYNLEYSKLAYRNGSIIQTVWESAVVDVLQPGVPVRYIFLDGETPRELYGTLIAVEALDYRDSINVGETVFTTMALLTIFVSRRDPTKKPNYGTVTLSKVK